MDISGKRVERFQKELSTLVLLTQKRTQAILITSKKVVEINKWKGEIYNEKSISIADRLR